MNTNLFLIDLYNLHLPDEPSSEVKQNLTKTIWKHNKSFWQQVMGDKLEKKEISIPWLDKVSVGRVMIIADERSFEIKTDYLGYQSSDVDWWLSDYPSFLEEYNRLRSFVDDYIKGKFNTKNYVWLNETLTRFPYELSIDFDSRFQMSLVELEACFSGKMSDKVKEIDINRVNIGFCFNQSKMTANEVILAPAYIEIIDLIRTKTVHFGKCKRNGCNNIFLKAGNRKYCDTCKTPAKREVDKQTKRRKAELNHIRLSALIDKWLPEKGDMSITAYSLMWKLKGISEPKREPRYLQSPRSLGRYLNLKEMQDMLEEKGIHIKVCKDRKGATYNFTKKQ